jgi:hypothetical protein
VLLRLDTVSTFALHSAQAQCLITGALGIVGRFGRVLALLISYKLRTGAGRILFPYLMAMDIVLFLSSI